MGSAAGGRYSYTAGNARLCGSLGIEGTTYQIGFDAVRELLGPIKGKIFLDFGCGAGRSARLPESPRCQARLRRRSRSGHDRRGRISRAWRGDLLSFRRRHPAAGRICRRRCQPERLRGDTHTVKTSLVGSGHRLARCPCRAARYGNPGTPTPRRLETTIWYRLACISPTRPRQPHPASSIQSGTATPLTHDHAQ